MKPFNVASFWPDRWIGGDGAPEHFAIPADEYGARHPVQVLAREGPRHQVPHDDQLI